MTPPAEVLVLIACVALLALMLGLPLLPHEDSLIPDLMTFGLLGMVSLAFLWGTGAYWTLPDPGGRGARRLAGPGGTGAAAPNRARRDHRA